MNLADQYNYYSFVPYDDRGSLLYTSSAEWASATAHLNEVMTAAVKGLSPDVAAQEWEVAEKNQVCWRDKGLGALIQLSDLIVSNAEQATILAPRLDRLGLRYARAIESAPTAWLNAAYFEATVPLKKGKGAPYWFSGTDSDIVLPFVKLCESARDLAHLDQLLMSAGDAVLRPVITTYGRTQATAKLLDAYTLVDGKLQATSQRRGPRNRKVQGQPYCYNFPTAGTANVMRELMKRMTDRNSGRIDEAAAAVKSSAYAIASDLSGYDDSVGGQLLTCYRELVLKRVVDALARKGIITARERNLVMEIDEHVQTLEMLTPPSDVHSGATLIATSGGIHSGERLTSVKGTDINRERIDEKLAVLGLPGKGFNYGDDTVVVSSARRLADRWASLPSFAGFNETVAPCVSFLMKKLPEGYAFLSRMLFGTLNREVTHEPANLAIAAAGVRIRNGLLKGHPSSASYLEGLRGVSGRGRLLAEMSEGRSESELLEYGVLSARSMKSSQVEDLIDLVRSSSSMSSADKERLIGTIDSLRGASQMTVGAAKAEVRGMPLRLAMRSIRDKAYTTRSIK